MRKSRVSTIISFVTVVCFFALSITPPAGFAQNFSVGSRLPPAGQMVPLSSPFDPVLIRGLKIYPKNPFRMDFIVDGGQATLDEKALKSESEKLIKYFLAALTVPEKELWVNLSPYEKDRIIPQAFGVTEMGRDLLAQDYLLKQITSSLMYPESELGQKFWQRVHKEAAAKHRIKEIPVETFNKVWIVPEKAVVYVHGDMAYVVESRLKVLLESDYQAMNKTESSWLIAAMSHQQ